MPKRAAKLRTQQARPAIDGQTASPANQVIRGSAPSPHAATREAATWPTPAARHRTRRRTASRQGHAGYPRRSHKGTVSNSDTSHSRSVHTRPSGRSRRGKTCPISSCLAESPVIPRSVCPPQVTSRPQGPSTSFPLSPNDCAGRRAPAPRMHNRLRGGPAAARA